MEKILIIEDNDDYATILKHLLKEDYHVTHAKTGKEGIECAIHDLPNLILLDILLGDLDGFEVCHRLKQHKLTTSIPIIFLSSRADSHSKVMGLDLGAADYIVKPFDNDELLARVKKRLSEHRMTYQSRPFEVPGLKIDPTAQRVFMDGVEVNFSQLEFKLLAYLVKNANCVLSRETILEHVWPESIAVTDRVIDSHIRSIRRKLAPYKRYIESIYGGGYRFNANDNQVGTKKAA